MFVFWKGIQASAVAESSFHFTFRFPFLLIIHDDTLHPKALSVELYAQKLRPSLRVMGGAS